MPLMKLLYDSTQYIPSKDVGWSYLLTISNILIYFSGKPYFRAIFSINDALSLFAWNTSESNVGSGYAEHGDGIEHFTTIL